MISFKEYLTEQNANTVTMDVPLFLRLLEFAKEDAKSDLDLHYVAENIVRIQTTRPLCMKDYEAIVKVP